MAADRERGAAADAALRLGARRLREGVRWWAAAVVVLALAKGLLWTQLLPPWYGPDELAHFDYVQVLALTGRIPAGAASRTDGADVPQEVSCSAHDAGFRSSGPFAAEPPYVPDPSPCPMPAPGRGMLPAVATNPAGAYGPAYYAMAVPIWRAAAGAPVEVRLEAIRLLSVALGALAALCCYLAAFWAFGGERRAAATAAVVFTLQPMLSQQTAVVTNDALVIAAGAAFFWRLMRAIRRPPTALDMAVLGALVGVSFMAKPQGALLAVLVPAALLPGIATARASAEVVRRSAGRLAVAAGAAAAVAAVALAGQSLLHGSPVPVAPPAIAASHTLRDYVHMLLAGGGRYPAFVYLYTFWGEFAWTAVALPAVAYQAICAALALAAVGVAWALRRWREGRWTAAVALASVVVVWAALLAAEALTFTRTGGQLLQGRDFFLALVPLVILVVMGLVAPFRGRLRGVAAAWTCAAALALQAVSCAALLGAFFS